MPLANQAVRARAHALNIIDRSPTAKRAMASAIRWWLSRRGPLNVIADEAVSEASTREAKRTAEMLMWSGAVAGISTFPKWFPVAHHVHDPVGRRLSADALADHLSTNPDAPSNLWRQYFFLTEPDDLDEVRAFVRRDLESRLIASSQTAPADRVAMPGARQHEILRRAIEALESAGIRPFLVSGTLLGLVREGRLMDHDYDIDLGVLPEESDAETVGAALESASFEVKVQTNKVLARGDSDFGVDVFMHYERDGLYWHGTEIHEWWNTPFGLERADLLGLTVWIPDNAETYLKENYGNWQRPVAFYHFSFDTPNRRYRSTYQALLFLYKRVAVGLDFQDRWIVESAARELRDRFGVDITDSFNPTALLEPSESNRPT